MVSRVSGGLKPGHARVPRTPAGWVDLHGDRPGTERNAEGGGGSGPGRAGVVGHWRPVVEGRYLSRWMMAGAQVGQARMHAAELWGQRLGQLLALLCWLRRWDGDRFVDKVARM
jgi:hypothetical protein